MKINKKYLLVIPAFALAGLTAVGSVSAMGMGGGFHGQKGFGGGIGDPEKWAERINDQATLLGLSPDDMKSYWSQGKNINDIATEKGITKEQLKAKFDAAREVKMKSQLQALVTKGHVTQAQADARLTVMKQMKTKMTEKMKNRPAMKRIVKPNRSNGEAPQAT